MWGQREGQEEEPEAVEADTDGAEGHARRPLVSGFHCNFFCPAILHLLCPLLGALYFLCQMLFGERGGEVAATESDLQGGTADRKQNSAPP